MFPKILLYIFIFVACSTPSQAAEQKRYDMITVSDEVLSLTVDVEKKNIVINSINIKSHLPTGDIEHVSHVPYTIAIKKIRRTSKTEITYSGTDWYDGIGVEIKVTVFYGEGINAPPESADVLLTSNFEELSLSVNEQLMKVSVVTNTTDESTNKSMGSDSIDPH
jgi:uncharacterized protein YcfL